MARGDDRDFDGPRVVLRFADARWATMIDPPLDGKVMLEWSWVKDEAWLRGIRLAAELRLGFADQSQGNERRSLEK